ncbi:MAG TPA: hypothetical protein VIJ42_02420 [Stellaceae bacterium]
MWSAKDIRIELSHDETEGSIGTAIIRTPVGSVKVMAEIELVERRLTLARLHIHGLDVERNVFGGHRLKWLCQAVLEEFDLDELVIMGETRTTGAGPGHRPRPIRFTRTSRS